MSTPKPDLNDLRYVALTDAAEETASTEYMIVHRVNFRVAIANAYKEGFADGVNAARRVRVKS